MKILNVLTEKDFVDKKSVPTIGCLSNIFVSEANFRTLLLKFNEMVAAYNQLAIKVYDINQALKTKKNDKSGT